MDARESNRSARNVAKEKIHDVADHASRSATLIARLWSMVSATTSFPLPDGGRGKGKRSLREGYLNADNVQWSAFENSDNRVAFAAGWTACLLTQRKREMRAINAESATSWTVSRMRLGTAVSDRRRSHRACVNPRLNALAIFHFLSRIPCNDEGESMLSDFIDTMPATAKLNRRTKAIIPQPFAAPTDPRRMVLPVELPDMPGPFNPNPNTTLQGLEIDATQPALVAALLAGSFGDNPKRRLALRLFVECLLSVPAESRNDTVVEISPIHVREIVVDWLQWDARRYAVNDRRSGQMLREALPQINTMAIPWGDNGGFYYPLLLRGATGWRLKDTISILAQLPTGGEVGPMIDRSVLRFLGAGAKMVVNGKRQKQSGAWAAWRLYLALSFDWNKHGSYRRPQAKRGGGKHALIRATRPEVRRNEEGSVLNADGDVLYRSNGSAVTSPWHPAAHKTGSREANPARTKYLPKTVDDLVAMTFTEQPPANRGVYRNRAIEAALLLERLHICHIERIGVHGRGFPWRIIPGDAPFDSTDHGWPTTRSG